MMWTSFILSQTQAGQTSSERLVMLLFQLSSSCVGSSGYNRKLLTLRPCSGFISHFK